MVGTQDEASQHHGTKNGSWASSSCFCSNEWRFSQSDCHDAMHETPCICLVLVLLAYTSTSICWGLKAKTQLLSFVSRFHGEQCIRPAYAMCFMICTVALAHAGGMHMHLQQSRKHKPQVNLFFSRTPTFATCQWWYATSTSKCWGMRTEQIIYKVIGTPFLSIFGSFGKSLVFALCLQQKQLALANA